MKNVDHMAEDMSKIEIIKGLGEIFRIKPIEWKSHTETDCISCDLMGEIICIEEYDYKIFGKLWNLDYFNAWTTLENAKEEVERVYRIKVMESLEEISPRTCMNCEKDLYPYSIDVNVCSEECTGEI